MLWVTFTNWIFTMVPLNVRAAIVGAPRQPKEKDSTLKVGDEPPTSDLRNISVMVKSAKCLPKMDLSGKADPYVTIHIGAKEKKTAVIKKTLDPTWNESFMFELRQNSTANIVFTVMDRDNVGHDEPMGYVSIPVQEVFEQQNIEREYELMHKDGKAKNETLLNDKGESAKLSLLLSYSQEEHSGDAEWLNGVIRKAYRVIRPKVNKQVQEQLNATFAGLGIPVIKLELASFSIGQSSPWLMGLELLPSRSDQDIQVNSTLRWVADGEFVIKVLAKAGPLSISVAVSDLEIQFPAWIQVRLQAKDPAAPAMSALQLAATDEPTVRFSISFGGVSTASIPGVESAIDYAIRRALKSALVLPNKMPAVDPEKMVLPLEPAQKTAVGRVSVKFYEGDDLKIPGSGVFQGIVDAVGTCDPYIFAQLGPDKKTTKTISNSTKPKWNEFAEFLVQDEEKDTLLIDVLDAGPVNAASMGKVEIKVATLLETKGWTEGWYELQGNDIRQGKIRMAVEYAKLVPDDGPKVALPEIEPGEAAVTDVTAKPNGEGEREFLPPPEEPKEPPKIGKMLIRVISASDLPAMDIGGKSDPYVVISSPVTGSGDPDGKNIQYLKRKTKTVKENLNPIWEEEFGYMESMDEANMKKIITLHVKDADQFGTDEWMGKIQLHISDIMAAGENGEEKEFDILGKEKALLKDKNGKQSKLKVFYSFSESAMDAATDVGAEWLNGVLRKGFRLFGKTIDDQVKASMKTTFENLGPITGVKKIELENFSIGRESPWIMEMKLLSTRSDQDIQLMTRLRWVTDGKMMLKIKVTTSAGVSLTVTAKNLELEFPAWIKAGIQSGLEEGADEAWAKAKVAAKKAWEEAQAAAKEKGEEGTEWVEPPAEPPVLTGYKVAATEEPILKFKLALGGMSFGSIPGLEDTLDGAIRSAIHNALVLPNAIASNFVDVVPKLTDLEKKAVGRLSIKVYEAEGLVDPDAWGTCDPFVGITLPSSKSEDKQPKKTKTVYNTTSPRWNTFLEMLVLEPSTDKLKIEVLDEDLYKTDTLGTLTLQVREFVAVVGWTEKWYTLNGGSGAKVRLGVCYEKIAPEEGPPAPPDPTKKPNKKAEQAAVAERFFAEPTGPRGKLLVNVAKAAKLPKMDFFGGADPFVIVRHGAEEVKTKVIKKELNPAWDEKLELKYQGEQATLIFEVKDWEKVGKNETMGFVRVPWADVEAGDGEVKEYPIITRDGDDVKDGKGEASKLFVGIKLQLDA